MSKELSGKMEKCIVGAAVGRISLYKGKECIEKNIPESDAIPHLIALIKENGDWIEK